MSQIVPLHPDATARMKMLLEPTCESDLPSSSDEIVERSQKRLAENPAHAHYFQHVTCHYAQRVLIVRGRVPTDPLRHTLICLLSALAEVEFIDNQVDVISSTGLSSIRPEVADVNRFP